LKTPPLPLHSERTSARLASATRDLRKPAEPVLVDVEGPLQVRLIEKGVGSACPSGTSHAQYHERHGGEKETWKGAAAGAKITAKGVVDSLDPLTIDYSGWMVGTPEQYQEFLGKSRSRIYVGSAALVLGSIIGPFVPRRRKMGRRS